MRVAIVETCPLCGSADATQTDRFRYDDIWRELEIAWGASVGEATRRSHEFAEVTTLVRCETCGLEYFTPALAGDQTFYEELMATLPYNEQRWEFRQVSRRLSRDSDIVDFGCGEGGFLRWIGRRVRRAVGVDHNVAAVERLRASGIEAYAEPFDTFSSSNAGAFDAVCAFHTLEHTASADLLMCPALACLRPGGSVFVSGPNRERVGRARLEPQDGPPHHVSRWAPAQMRSLAERYGLMLVDLQFEPPGFHDSREWFAHGLTREWASLVGRRSRSRGGSRALALARYAVLRRSGWFVRHGVHGHSMLAELRREAP